MKRLMILSLVALFLLGMAFTQPAVAKKPDKEEKEKSNNRVEKFLVCHVSKRTPTDDPTVELASGKVIAIPASAVDAHLQRGDALLPEDSELEAGDRCEFLDDAALAD